MCEYILGELRKVVLDRLDAGAQLVLGKSKMVVVAVDRNNRQVCVQYPHCMKLFTEHELVHACLEPDFKIFKIHGLSFYNGDEFWARHDSKNSDWVKIRVKDKVPVLARTEEKIDLSGLFLRLDDPKVGYVNLYRNPDGRVFSGEKIYETYTLAMLSAGSTVMKTIKITWGDEDEKSAT